jgi:hypothetical protein
MAAGAATMLATQAIAFFVVFVHALNHQVFLFFEFIFHSDQFLLFRIDIRLHNNGKHQVQKEIASNENEHVAEYGR